ncbi:MAG: hypothetical protein MZV70_18775 [Desulfobacterales bacterium]|nr:hypothetical protein [Desulfobacterales bacterium]
MVAGLPCRTVSRASRAYYAIDAIIIRGARQHNLKNIDVDDPARPHDRDHRAFRVGQVHPRLRHPLCRGAAPLRGVALRPTPASSSSAWKSRMSTSSRGCPRPSPSSRKRPATTRARRSAR